MCRGARGGLHGGNDNAKLGLGLSMGPSPYNTLTRDSLQDHHNEMIPTFFTNSCGFRRVYDTVIIKGGMGC